MVGEGTYIGQTKVDIVNCNEPKGLDIKYPTHNLLVVLVVFLQGVMYTAEDGDCPTGLSGWR